MKFKYIAISAAVILVLLEVAFLIYQRFTPAEQPETEGTAASQVQETEGETAEGTVPPELTMPVIPFDVGMVVETTAPQDEEAQEPAATEQDDQTGSEATEPEKQTDPVETEPVVTEPAATEPPATETVEETEPEMTIPEGLDENELPPVPF